jgi:hypothetical protein
MKLFKQLLVAPAALGLLAPVAATAAELNLDGVNKYASEEQVTSISQFSDVKPTDWAYQALSNLIERYGCVAGYPDGTYKGARAMTRFEAAALLNACLDRVTEVTDELKKLMAEFEKELAILKGRVDGLEAKVGELEANQFSTTTKLKGIATFVIGGADNTIPGFVAGQTANTPLVLEGGGEQVTFNYDVRLILDTSFTGKDLLRTTLRTGNFGNSAFGAGPTALEVAFDEEAGSEVDAISVNRLFYQFPIGSSFTATVGAKVRQDDMLGMWPSVYPSDSILDMFTYAGAPGAYNLNLGGGFGLTWKDQGVNVSVNYVANSAVVGDSDSGLGNADTVTAQVGYTGNNWGAAFVYTYSNSDASAIVAPGSTAVVNFGSALVPYESNNIGFSAYWQPSEAGWMPSISAGFGYGKANVGGDNDLTGDIDLWSWMVGLQWSDVFVKGNDFGIGLGMPQWADADGAESNFAMEFWYKFQVTDNITVTPAIFFIDGSGSGLDDNSQTTVGGLLKTTFKF